MAILADQSPTSSGYANNLSALKTAGFIEYPGNGTVRLTSTGEDAAVITGGPSASAEGMRAAFLAKLPRPQARILSALIEVYPEAMDREALAEKSEQSPTSSGYANNLSALKSLGVIDYPEKRAARAASILFIKENV